MGFVEKRKEFRPEIGDAPFAIDELFFSRTNKRGIIQAGNYIFKRVAHYDWDQLIGAPHKIIRHPDMPKGVFSLFWETLQRDELIGAYVKNKASDGLEYWVFAVAMPLDDGYISVRIKPSSEMLGVIKALYADLKRVENDDKVNPEDSARSLLERINHLGHDDYASFESECLMRELAARNHNMGNPVTPEIVTFDEIMSASKTLKAETKALSDGFEAISTVPTNMRIIAARLEPSGGAVSSLSQNYWSMSEEMSEWFAKNVTNEGSEFASIHKTLNSCRFLFGTALMLSTLTAEFNREQRTLGGCDLEFEKKMINKLSSEYVTKAVKGLQQVSRVAAQIVTSAEIMRRYTLGLSSTRVMCNIESARLPNGGGSLVDVIHQLGQFQNRVEKQLGRIEDLSLQIIDHTEMMIANHCGLENGP